MRQKFIIVTLFVSFLFFFSIFLPASLKAEHYICNGVISNLTCDSIKSAPILTAPPTPNTPTSQNTEDDKLRKQKTRMLYNYDALRLAAQRTHGIVVDFEAIRTVCNSISFTECEKLLYDRKQDIEAQKLKIDEYREKQKKDKAAANKKLEQSNNNTTVTIINDNSRNLNQGINIGTNPRGVRPRFPRYDDNGTTPYWTPDYSGSKPIPTPDPRDLGSPENPFWVR